MDIYVCKFYRGVRRMCEDYYDGSLILGIEVVTDSLCEDCLMAEEGEEEQQLTERVIGGMVCIQS